jgi:dTDP-glucose 4,6-dehydratase
MKLLVTGGLGFIGSNFILDIIQNHNDFKVTNVDDQLYGSNTQNLLDIKDSKNYQFVKGNITNETLLEKLVSDCDAVVNFAAESHVDRSIANINPFIESNIVGVSTLLNVINKHKKKFLHVSTDEVYGSLKNESAKEESRFNPSSPYAASKAAGELLINSFITTYDCDCMITRCTNNYGPRQFPEKLIPKTILLAQQNKKIPVYGNGKNIRDWIYVTDHCKAIVDVLLKGRSGQSYNISADNEIDNLTIIKKILTIMDKSMDLIEFVEDRPGHDYRYSLDSSKIRNNLDWSQKINFDTGLQDTINWYQSNKQWWENIAENTFNATPWKN